MALYWPEFAANGKEGITLGCLMSHQAGVSGCPEPMTLEDLYAWTSYLACLESMAPEWPPGSRCVYHALAHGHLAGEVLRQVDGRSPGAFIADEIAGPLAADFFLGLPGEDHRAVEVVPGPGAEDSFLQAEERPLAHGYVNPRVGVSEPNTRAWRARGAGGNGQGDALGLARIYGALATGGGEAIACSAPRRWPTAERFAGLEAAFEWPIRFAAGFMLNEAEAFGLAGRLGHSGLGGSCAFADPEAGIGVAYVMNRLLGFEEEPDPRRQRLFAALYGAVATRRGKPCPPPPRHDRRLPVRRPALRAARHPQTVVVTTAAIASARPAAPSA